MNHILSIDFEDWHQLICKRVTGRSVAASDNVQRQTDILLSLLERHQTKATFFILGLTAEHHPTLVQRISAQGHEIASHGYSHTLASTLSRESFLSDTRKSLNLIEDICGKKVLGYRAAEFSIGNENIWALDALAELGFAYDSSIFPIRHRRYGIPGFWPEPARYLLESGRSIIEIPPATIPVSTVRLPIAGGGYFRWLPYRTIASCVQRFELDSRVFVCYFHPYEFDSMPLDASDIIRPATVSERCSAFKFNVHQNIGRTTVYNKLSQLLKRYRFNTCEQYLSGVTTNESRTLFSAHS